MREGYSIDSIKEVLERASTPETLVIPILNVYGTGPRIGRLVPSVHVLDGCIYIVGFVSGEGEITQMGSIFRLVFGARPEQGISCEQLNQIAEELRACGIKVDVSDDINRDTFIKWAFISAMHVPEPTTMCPWAKCSTKARCAIPLSDYRRKVPESGANWV